MNTWSMGSQSYPYFHPLAGTERDIELAYAQAIFETCAIPVLEVGNSTQRHIPGPPRDIVDRYDVMGGQHPVHQADILEWDPPERYGLILSVSTFEHVGWEEPEEIDDLKAIRAVEHCLDLLAPGGQLVFTIPTGYHPHFAQWVADTAWTEIHLMERINDAGEWVERPLAEFEPQEFPGPWGWSARKVLFVRQEAPS